MLLRPNSRTETAIHFQLQYYQVTAIYEIDFGSLLTTSLVSVVLIKSVSLFAAAANANEYKALYCKWVLGRLK